jgi:hypothetical protein
MIKIANQEEALSYHEQPNGLKYYRQDYFEKEIDDSQSPQSYLIKQLPNITNPLHFHVQNQFQVFIEGSGFFGRHTIEPYIVHYAGAYTGYGPIVAGPLGLDYLTLRSMHDPGAKFLPEKKNLFIQGPKHHFTSRKFLPSISKSIQELKSPEFFWDHFEVDNGLGIGLLKMPSFTSYLVKPSDNVDGIFLVVIGGAVIVDGVVIGVKKNIFASSKEKPFEIKVQDGYAELLVLQMPLKEKTYQR